MILFFMEENIRTTISLKMSRQELSIDNFSHIIFKNKLRSHFIFPLYLEQNNLKPGLVFLFFCCFFVFVFFVR